MKGASSEATPEEAGTRCGSAQPSGRNVLRRELSEDGRAGGGASLGVRRHRLGHPYEGAVVVNLNAGGGKVHPHGGHTVNAPDLPFDLRHAGRAEKPSERRTVRVVEAAVVIIVLFLRSRTTPSWGGIDDVTQAATGEP